LSPFKRIKLNKRILELYLSSFEEKGEIEKIIHYAKNSNENALVTKYAPAAAMRAAEVGAHLQASKLYLTAIQHGEENDPDKLVELYEAYAYECYLTNQVKEAIIYQGKALSIWKTKNKKEKIGKSLSFLSRLWWVDGNTKEAEKFATEAIEILALLPSSIAKGMAYSNMSQLKMYADDISECLQWGNRAIETAYELADPGILAHAMTNIGTVQWNQDNEEDQGRKLLFGSLSIALEHSFEEHAARAQSNIIYKLIQFRDYDAAQKILKEGIAYCEERDLNSSRNYKYYLKARIHFETGDWKKAENIIQGIMNNPSQPKVTLLGAMTILAKIKTRRGDPDSITILKDARSMAFLTMEHQQVVPIVIACLEYEWLNATTILSDSELEYCLTLVGKVNSIQLNSELAFWIKKARNKQLSLEYIYEPYQDILTVKYLNAARFWESLNCPFEQAISLMDRTEEDSRKALTIFSQVGALAFVQKVQESMRSAGIKKVPRGVRASTRNNPAKLTNRELEVLSLLYKGAQTKEIASTLYISPKTVDHHITSLFAKLEVTSRTKAVTEALRLQIIK
jgi:ATP/maltotriose-dependent transcriptional regulator MalT